MLKRILSAFLFIPLVVFSIFETMTGGILFFALILISTWLTVNEYFDLLGEGVGPKSRIVGVTSVVMTVCLSFVLGGSLKQIARLISQSDLLLSPGSESAIGQLTMILSLKIFALALAFLIVILLAFFLIQISRKSFEGAFREVGQAFLAIPWIGFGFGSLLVLHSLPDKGSWLVLWTFLVVWVTDSFAYFVGKLLGRHSLGLAASPNKTLEGTIGGLAFGLLAAMGLKLAFPEAYSSLSGAWPIFEWPIFLFLTFILSLVGQIGDLAESVLKRSLGTKDSGGVIPGHGGFLDVFDAQLVVSPFALCLTIILAGLA